MNSKRKYTKLILIGVAVWVGRRLMTDPQFGRDLVHNVIVHPAMMIVPLDIATAMHDRNADWAFSQNRFDEIAAEQAIAKAKGANQMKLLTASLTSNALDWALNHALMLEHGFVPEIAGALGEPSEMYKHTDPALCLWLIKEYRASIDQVEHDPLVEVHIWFALTDEADPDFDCQSVIGDTVEQAVARCVVQMRLGDEVDVPEELVGEKS